MKTDWSHLEPSRKEGPPGATYGMFMIRQPSGDLLCVIACDSTSTGWEHVSAHVRRKHRNSVTMHTPSWDQMCFLKSLFWEPTEVVMQLHPAEADHINVHQHVLHLWKPAGLDIPMPPKILV